MGLSRREFLKDAGLVGLVSLLGMYNFAKKDANAFSLKSLLGGKEEHKIPYSPDVYEKVIRNLGRFYTQQVKNAAYDYIVGEEEDEEKALLTDYKEWKENIEKAKKQHKGYAFGWFHPGSPSGVSKIWWEFIKENKVPYGDKIDHYIVADEDEWTGKKYLIPLLTDKHTPTMLAYKEPIFLYLTPQGYKGKHFPEILNISPDVLMMMDEEYVEDLKKAGKYPEKVNPFYVFLLEVHDPKDEETEKIKRIDVGFAVPCAWVKRKNGVIEDINLDLPIFSLEAEYKKNKKQPEIMLHIIYGIYPVLDTLGNERFVLVPKK